MVFVLAKGDKEAFQVPEHAVCVTLQLGSVDEVQEGVDAPEDAGGVEGCPVMMLTQTLCRSLCSLPVCCLNRVKPFRKWQ